MLIIRVVVRSVVSESGRRGLSPRFTADILSHRYVPYDVPMLDYIKVNLFLLPDKHVCCDCNEKYLRGSP